MSAGDEKFMRSALKLAAKGIGSVEPNPAVGCIIVKAGQVVGKGYHKTFGGPHAEINAIEDCKMLGVRPEGATMYVTLEPCGHEGKTPPCTSAIIDAGLARVIVAVTDPSEHAKGRGLEQLRQAGVDVEVGLCAEDAQRLNAPFFKHATTGTCWVVLKWAQSIDGKLAYVDQSPEKRWITNEASRRDAQKLRRRAGAIVVGINTVLADDPLLSPRPSKGRKPIRVALDNGLRIPLRCRLLRTTKSSPVLVVAQKAAVEGNVRHFERIKKRGADVVVHEGAGAASNLRVLLDELARRGVQQVLVEGGPTVLASFLREGLGDEVCVYISPKILGAGGDAYLSELLADPMQTIELHHVGVKSLAEDVCLTGLLTDLASQPARSQDGPS